MSAISPNSPPDNTAPPPNTPVLPMPGVAICALAVATGAHRFDVASGVAAILGAIAGPFAGPKSVFGDLIDPAFHLLAAADHSAAWRRLEELLFEPVAACQQRLRELSRLTSAARLDHRQFSRFADHTDEIIEFTKPQMFDDPGIPTPPVYPEQHIAALRTPTFFLQAPDETTWAKAQSEILHAQALVRVDGSILEPARVDRSARGSASLTNELVAAATGCDRFVERGKQAGPGRLNMVKANLFVSASRDAIATTLSSQDSSLQRLLQTCVFALPSRDPYVISLKPEYLRPGYEAYRAAVNKVLGLRRSGDGYRVDFKPDLSKHIEHSSTSIRNWCAALPPRLQPYFAHMSSLPHRFAWAFLATLGLGESADWVAPFVRGCVQHVLIAQKDFIEAQLRAAEIAREQHARQIMLQKLASSGPCLLRVLLRRYSNQRRELHLPVLDALMNEGLVRQREDGRLELAGASTVRV